MPELTRLNDHIRRDALRRLWWLYIGFLAVGLFMSCFFLIPFNEQDVRRALYYLLPLSPDVLKHENLGILVGVLIMAVGLPLLGFAAGNLLAQIEKSVYRLYTVLPTASAKRGRRIWLRQAIIAPSIVCGVPVILTAFFLNIDPTPWRAFMFMVAWRMFFTALAIPALLLLVSGRSLHYVSPRLASLGYAVTVPMALIHYAAILRFGAAAFGALSWLLFLTPILSLIAISYARAPRLALANPIKEPVPAWPKVPNTPQSLGSFTFSVAMRTIGASYLLFLVLGVLASAVDFPARTDKMFDHFAMDSMLAGICTFTIFITAGRFIAEQMRVLRLLPLTPSRIALGALLYATAATALTMPAIGLMTLVATPGRSPFIIAGAVLLAADAGCLAAALQVRLGRWAAQVNMFLFAISSLTMMTLSTPIHDQPAIVDASLFRVVLAAFPLCLLAGFIGIRRAIQRTSAGVYRDFFLEKFAPQ
ncbi:MAG: hypothetical protein NTZ09_06165 [Candidatus Hydrogenedentes bacterium]|nr:hypothetical protein [Candidatus Hydrogenedentota bacterium]